MNPKQVWGVIIIVLGVLSVLGGLAGFYTLSMFEKDTLAMSRMIESSPFLDKEYVIALGMDSESLKRTYNQGRVRNFASILFGIVLSFVGTIMFKKRQVEAPFNETEVFDEDRPFVIQVDHKKAGENDDTRWMPPEMRNQISSTTA